MKRSKVLFILFILLCSMFFSSEVTAATSYVTVIDNSVRVRSGAGTSYDKLETVDSGVTFDLIDTTLYPDDENKDCEAGWYKIDYKGSEAYICSYYVKKSDYVIITEEAKTACESELKTLGFPASYWSGICEMKIKHPTWSFKPILTGLDWEYVITKESSCGKSLIQTTNAEYIDTTCNSGYGTWKPASKKAVAYYMDPRNFLSENTIFQFEYLRYEASLNESYLKSSASMLANASFYKYHSGIGNNLSVIINTAGSEADVNPVHISARMLQELGTGTSLYNLYSGVYTGHEGIYKGYYNFFNIGVSDSCATTNGTSYCGLSYAKSKGWNSPLNAIKGGASFLGNSYIAKGQYSIYLQKFNVVPTNSSSLFVHQYMTNIVAPSSESKSTYSTYNKQNLLDTAFAFYIPVYTNMNAVINNSGSGASNDEDDNSSLSTLSASTIVTSAGFKLKSENLSGVELGMSASEMIDKLEAISGKGAITITDKKGNKLTGVITTDTKVSIKTSTETKVLTVIVKGDSSGDGKINALDLLQVQKHNLGVSKLEGSALLAADTSGDGKVNALDLLQIQKHNLKVKEIEQ